MEAFGGDPTCITLAGQSGGAFSIAALAQHPGARDLFHRGILQSAPLGLELPTAEDAATRTRALARHLGHSSIDALRSEPWENLIAGTIGVLGEYAEFGEWSPAYGTAEFHVSARWHNGRSVREHPRVMLNQARAPQRN